ncbi:lectin [Lysobacter sp. F60174L2]|uniref:lectin n=1 Tax=Lysobacter sp. F60174L2 TaxID=3459295 RepID=UPI00403DB9A8
MKLALPALTLLVLAMAACADRGAGDAATAASAPPAVDQPSEDVPPATAPPGTRMPGDVAGSDASDSNAGEARFDGYGPARFGMSADEVIAAWDGELNGEPAADGSSCFHLNPVGQPDIAYFALMFEGGKFVRYSVSNETMSAPGGGQVGMDSAQIEALYPGIEQQNHKYVEGGHYLRAGGDGGEGVVVFETGADDVVTEWRVGLPPQVDYVEGCS